MIWRMWQLCLCLSLVFRAGRFAEIENIKDATSAEIVSDNYPNSYPSNFDKEWHFTHDYGRWLITIVDMRIETSEDCIKDYLEIVEDGALRSKKYCGLKTNMVVVTKGSNAKIRFHSDGKIQDRGFKILIKRIVDDEGKKKKSQQDAAKGFVHKSTELLQWEFVALAATVGSALVLFSGLIIFLICEMRKKRIRRQSGNINSTVFQWPPRQRSNSKSYGRQQSNSSTAPLTNDRFMY